MNNEVLNAIKQEEASANTKRSRLPMSSSMQFWRPERMRQPAWENSRR